MKNYMPTPFHFACKEPDPETGLYYFGARYLDPKTSRWMSVDPAMGEYFPSAPVNDEARRHNENLPGLGGVFNYVNLHVYHYSANNPVKYVDPDGRIAEITRNGNNISIVIPVVFLNGTPRERAHFIKAAEKTWSGQFGDFNVTLKVEERSPSQGRVNTVKWEDNPSLLGEFGNVRNNRELTLFRRVRIGFGRFDVYNARDLTNIDFVVAHEVGHLMNLEENRDSQNVMSNTAVPPNGEFSVSQKNIEDIIANN